MRLRTLLTVTATVVAAAGLIRTDDGRAAPAWLDLINKYRAAAGVPSVTEQPAWSAGILAHLHYLALTPAELRVGMYASAHTENPLSAYYTPQGALEAASSDLTYHVRDEVAAINSWLTAPFHAIAMFRPNLRQVAFAHDPVTRDAGLDVIQGLVPGRTSNAPVLFPGPGATVDRVAYVGESPSPLETCHYDRAGLPLLALLPTDPNASIRAVLTGPDGTVTSDGDKLCVVTKFNFVTTDAVYGPNARATLEVDHAVVVIPRARLVAGQYTVTLNQPGAPDITWSFIAAPSPTVMNVTNVVRNDCDSGGSPFPLSADIELIDVAPAQPMKLVASVEGRDYPSATLTAEFGAPWWTFNGAQFQGLGGEPLGLDGTTSASIRLLDPTATPPRVIGEEAVAVPPCPVAATSITLKPFDPFVLYGNETTLTGGIVHGTSRAISGASVQLLTRPAGGAEWSTAATTTTDRGGLVAITVRPERRTDYAIRYSGSLASSEALSDAVSIGVRPALRITRVLPSRGARVIVTGSIRPATATGAVNVAISRGGKPWHVVARASIDRAGVLRIALPKQLPGAYRVRLERQRDPSFERAQSATAAFRVR
jgi:hypothetical protein